MKTARKAIMLVLCVVLLVVASVMGTLAYLTAEDTVTNTFTVGNIQINLDETDVTKTDGSRTEAGNAYHLLPGQTYVKDPTVTILAKSDESYVRMLVTVSDINEMKAAFPKDRYATWYDEKDNFLLQNLVTGWDKTLWECTGINGGVYEFRYTSKVNTMDGNPLVLDALFDNIVVPDTMTNIDIAHLNNATITVNAHAIQAAGFANAADAWDHFSTT